MTAKQHCDNQTVPHPATIYSTVDTRQHRCNLGAIKQSQPMQWQPSSHVTTRQQYCKQRSLMQHVSNVWHQLKTACCNVSALCCHQAALLQLLQTRHLRCNQAEQSQPASTVVTRQPNVATTQHCCNQSPLLQPGSTVLHPSALLQPGSTVLKAVSTFASQAALSCNQEALLQPGSIVATSQYCCNQAALSCKPDSTALQPASPVATKQHLPSHSSEKCESG